MESNVLAPLHNWIKEYRTFKDKMSTLDKRRLEFDAERRAYHKLELKRVHQQQATDSVEPELAGKLEAKGGDVAGMMICFYLFLASYLVEACFAVQSLCYDVLCDSLSACVTFLFHLFCMVGVMLRCLVWVDYTSVESVMLMNC